MQLAGFAGHGRAEWGGCSEVCPACPGCGTALQWAEVYKHQPMAEL